MLLLLLGCVAATVPPPEGPVGYPVDPSFTGDVAFEGAAVAYYPVTGVNDVEVWQSIRTSGPRVAGVSHGAYTTWDVRWTWPDGGTCSPVAVTTDIVVAFPRWDPPPEAPAASVGNWQRYVGRLAFHEQGHVDRIRGVSAQIPDVLGAAGCDGITTAGKDALAMLDALNATYDTETEHGAREGATLFVRAP